MVGLSQTKCCLILAVCFSLFTDLSASNFISDGIFGSSVLSERRLLQAKKPCPINFEVLNYNTITSKCKGPQYPANLCCPAFKEFACPFASELNDLSNDCATTMFSYINLSGRYPPGLFASLCREGKFGLECPAPSPQHSQWKVNANGGNQMIGDFLLPLVLMVSCLLFSLAYILRFW